MTNPFFAVATPYLLDAEPTQSFLFAANFEESQKDFDKRLQNLDPSKLLMTLTDVFSPVLALPMPSEPEQCVESLRNILNESEVRFEKLAECAKRMLQLHTEGAEEQLKLITTYSTVFDVEAKFREPPARSIVTSPLASWASASRRSLQPFNDLYTMMKFELADINAYQELLRLLDEQRSRADKAKKTAASWASKQVKTPKDEQQKQSDLQRDKVENELLECQVCSFVTSKPFVDSQYVSLQMKLCITNQLKNWWLGRLSQSERMWKSFATDQRDAAALCVEAYTQLANAATQLY